MPKNKTLEMRYLPLPMVHQSWDKVAPFMERSLAVAPDEYTIDQLKMLVVQGKITIILAVDAENNIHGVAAVEFQDQANYRTAFIVAMAGKGIVSSKVFGQLCELLKQCGATRVRCAASDAATRLYERNGLTKRFNLLEVNL